MNREEAIKIVKSHYPANKQMLNEALEFLIPELKESEDEKIRKDLITFLDEIWHLGKNANFDKWDKSDCSNWIAWLEKQAEQKSQGKSALEAIKEEKVDNANKVEPKFKVGDWIVWQDKCYKVNYNGCGYELVDQNGLSTSLEYGNIDENARLWDITKDAKEGDIIYAESKFIIFDFIVIFSKLENKNVWVYCSVCSDDDYYGDDLDHWDFDSDKGFIDLDSYKFYPASKELCDILFKSMKENGYKWDGNIIKSLTTSRKY